MTYYDRIEPPAAIVLSSGVRSRMSPRALPLVSLVVFLSLPGFVAAADEEVPAEPVAIVEAAGESPIPTAPAPALDLELEAEAEAQMNAFSRLRSWSDERLRAFYENIIVDAQDRHKFGARPQPHFGDLIHSDYTRLSLRYFYGFADKVEGEATFDNYFPTPGRGAHGIGFTQIITAVRYRWVPSFDPTGKATTGFKFNYPMHGTPDGFTEGVNRFSLFTSYARTSTWIPNFQEFFNLSYTVITPSGAIGSIASDLPQNDHLSVSLGWLRQRGNFTYGFTVGDEYVTDGPPVNFFTFTPTVMVSIPGRHIFRLPGEFQVGTSLAIKRYSDNTDYEFRIRVRWYVKVKELKEAWKNRRHRGAPAGS